MKNLIEIIINQIRQSETKSIPFDQFMHFALYYPKMGYYTKEKPKIGKQGDFYTAPYVTDVFAEIVCDYCIEDLQRENRAHFCEIGAGTGKFAHAFLSYIHKQGWDISHSLHYTAVEQSKYHQSLLRETPFPLHILDDIQLLEPFKGNMFANEWLDALPVKVVTKVQGALQEVVVCEKNGKLMEALAPVDDSRVISFLKTYNCEPQEDYRIEVPIYFEEVLAILSQKLISGKLILIDYLYPIHEWAQPELKDGSLRGFKNHQLKRDVLEEPGQMDITYNVAIEPLVSILERNGFSLRESARQDQFLLEHGILDKLEEHSILDPFDPIVKRNRAIQSLISPSGMSPYFHVLVFEK